MDHQHHVADDTLIRAIDRELPPDDLASVEAHWADCPRCRDRRVRLIRAAADFDGCYPTGVQTSDSRNKLVSALKSQRSVGSAWFATGTPLSDAPWRGAAVVAAVILIAVLVRTAARPDAPSPPASALPVAGFTPGATWELSAADLCGGVRATRPVSAGMRAEVLRAYRMEDVPADEYELDYLVTPELGGATDARNLWPQRYDLRPWNARVKDALETLLPELVCNNQISLETAQQEMARDWVAAYRKYFNSDEPLARHVAAADDDEVWVLAAYDAPRPRIRLVGSMRSDGRDRSMPRP